jgi:hypothetical protein
MNHKKIGTVKAALMAALLCLGATAAHAGVIRDLNKDLDRDVDNITHALGWDALDLRTVDQDEQGRPTLERSDNLVNLVERRTGYYSDGQASWQILTVVSQNSGKTLYYSKKTWLEDGKVDSNYSEDDLFNGDGKQMKGGILDLQYSGGLLTFKVRKRYSPVSDNWGFTLKQTFAYYNDGDLKERVSVDPSTDEQTRETWGVRRGTLGRKEYVEQWNSSRGVWE